jgi:hypothetical protein
MGMKRYDSDKVTKFGLSSKKNGKVSTSDGATYFIKSAFCRKQEYDGKRNPTWVANEVVYGTYAAAAGLRIPPWCLIDYGGATYFGSEMRAGRKEVKEDEVDRLAQAVKREENFWEVVRCLLLDVALLNSDRPATNVLLESDTVWFFDHTGALWGDGHGDLWRLEADIIGKKPPEKWVQDYLKSSTLNRVWHDPRMTADTVQVHFQALPLAICHLERARELLPEGWLREELVQQATNFLPKWWGYLREFLQQPEAIDTIRRCVGNIKDA